MKKNALYIVVLLLVPFAIRATGTNDISHVRTALDALDSVCATNRWDYWTIEDAMNFEWFKDKQAYREFATVVSNDWVSVLSHLCELATNNFERFLILGVGKTYDEDFYIEYMSSLSSMATNNIVSSNELLWACASTRFDLMSCLFRRYNEPRVIELIEKYKIAMPQHTNHWNDILSGVAYTNYLEEVEAGLWQ